MKLYEYFELLLNDHFEKGEREMESGMRTLAFQVSEELFQTVKVHLKKTGQSQKDFVIGLIEEAIQTAENEEYEETEV